MYQFIKLFLDNKMSIFGQYGAFKHAFYINYSFTILSDRMLTTSNGCPDSLQSHLQVYLSSQVYKNMQITREDCKRGRSAVLCYRLVEKHEATCT